MELRTIELLDAINPEPPIPKMFQMVLQGSIGTTVDQITCLSLSIFTCLKSHCGPQFVDGSVG